MALPKDFSPKTGSNYTMSGLNSGETVRMRTMEDFIVGQSVWGDDKPHRFKEGDKIPAGVIGTNKITGEPNMVKQFIATVVWNYGTEQFEVFETDKPSIIKKIHEYDQDIDYGDAKGYDLKVSKSGSGMQTRYSVLSTPPKPVSDAIKEAYEQVSVNLQSLFTGGNPFGSEVEEDVDF